jgi:DNA primase
VSGRIPQDFIDDLVQRADIVEVVGSRVPLTKAGREYKARCPFHSEKTPSFWVSPQKGFYHCFGCGAHGTALGFLMEFERLDFPVAVEELARSVGVEVPHTDSDRPSTEPLLAMLEKAANIYRQALRDHPAAVDYLKARGLDGETAREFGIGYAPAGWDTLLANLGTTEAARQSLLAAGLVIARDTGGFYDRFRDRIMFPIRDTRGRVIAFGGRIIASGEPKYLNSPETPLFHKGRELYGLYEARRAERKLERILVVEGYMDVVMLAAHGIHNAVGTLGTATTGEHLRRLFGVAGEIVFCFDGDRAGRDAAWRALQTSLPLLQDGRQIRFLLLPDNEDPDSLVRREGAKAFAERIGSSVPLSQFMLDSLSRDLDLDNLADKARLTALAKPLLAQLPEGVYRELLTGELARRVGLPRDRLAELMTGGGTQAQGQGQAQSQPQSRPREQKPLLPGMRPPTDRNAAADRRGSLSRQAISLLLHYPDVVGQIPLPDSLRSAGLRGVDLLCELHDLARSRSGVGTAALLERFRGRNELPHLAQLLTEEQLIGAEDAGTEFGHCLERLVVAAAQQELAALLHEAGQRTLSSEELTRLAELQRTVAASHGMARQRPDS